MNELRFNIKAASAKPLLQLKLGLTKRDSFLQGNMQLNSSLERVNFPVAEGAVVSLNKNHLSSVTEFSLPAKQVLSADKISQFTALSTVHYTAIIAGQNKKRTTQLSADATVEYSLNNGLMGISLMANKEPLLQAKGHVRQVVFSSEGRRQRGAVGTLLTNIKEPIGLEYNWQANTEEGLLVTGGELALKYIEKSKSLVDVQISNMKLNMPDSGAELEGSVQLKGQVDLAHIRNPLAIEGLSIESLNAVINTRVDIQGNQLTIKALSKNVLRAGSVRLNEHAGKAVSISIPKQAFNISLKTGNTSRFEFSLNGSNLSSDAFSMKELGLQTNANIKNNTINIHSTSAAVDANVSGKSYYIPPMVVKSSLKLKNSTVSKASFKIENMCNDPLLAVNWQPTKQMGDLVEIRWKQRFSNKKTLRKWLNTSQLPFDVTQGVFAGHVSISLGADDVKLRKLNVSVNNVDGIYGAGTFEGVQLQLSSNLQKLKLNETKQVVEFDTLYADIDGTVKQLNMGVKANNIVIKTAVYDALNEWHLKIPLLQANIFSGLAEVRDENINLSSDMQLDLILKQLDLSKLVETQGMEGLRATGKLSGRIPIQYANGKFNVLHGEMTSSKSGQIRYITPLSQSTNINEQLKLTLDVLENFNYTRLNSIVVYDDDTLYLKSAIAGNNPNVANGRPINLNLNTEVGLKGALEAMRIQSGIDSRIEAFVGSKVTASNHQYFCQ
jgi:hypothetical protein